MNELRTIHGWLFIVILLGLHLTVARAEFIAVDDFESLVLGPIDEQGAWTAEDTSSVVALDPAGTDNQVLEVRTESTHLFRDMFLADSTARMMFVRFRYADQLNASFGLSDYVHPYRFDHFEVELGLDNADDDLRINDGGTFEVLTTVQSNLWFNCWVLVDNIADQTQVWLHARGRDDANDGDQLSAEDQTLFLFRNTRAGDLRTFYIKTGGGSGLSGPLYIDDIYLEDTSELNLSNPSVPPPGGIADDLGTGAGFDVGPNPFTQQIAIDFTLSGTGEACLAVFGADGRHLTDLRLDGAGSGAYHGVWDGCDARGNPVATGVYYLRLLAGTESRTRRVVLID